LQQDGFGQAFGHAPSRHSRRAPPPTPVAPSTLMAGARAQHSGGRSTGGVSGGTVRHAVHPHTRPEARRCKPLSNS
jgi:hypothetical protein